jgi:hypothetical protein
MKTSYVKSKNNEAQHTLKTVQSEKDAVVKKSAEQMSIAKQMKAQRDDAPKRLVVSKNEKMKHSSCGLKKQLTKTRERRP